jgi:hypothetical protein
VVQERAVAEHVVVDRRREEAVARAPRREAVRQPLERNAQDPLGVVAEPVLRHHLHRVHCLGVRELLVRVARAVPPALHELLDQDRLLGVLHALFRHEQLRPRGEPLVPVCDERCAGAVVRRLIHLDRME